jgi:hypothetical protein
VLKDIHPRKKIINKNKRNPKEKHLSIKLVLLVTSAKGQVRI